MTNRVLRIKLIFINSVVIALILLLGNDSYILAQVPTGTPEKTAKKIENASVEKDSTEKAEITIPSENVFPIEPAQTQKDLNVVFNDKTPGVMIVEVYGKKYRIDSNNKTVVTIKENADEIANERNSEKEVTDEETVIAKSEEDEKIEDYEEESVWDFEKGEEPFDYRIINVPTPKSVPKGSWNLSFSHRFSQPIHPIENSGRNLLGFDSFSVSAFGIAYGITEKLHIKAARSPLCQRGLCRTIELGLGYNLLNQDKDTPIGLSTYASIEGDNNFDKNYTFNLQTMMSRRLGNRVYLFFSPAVHINSNGQGRFNPKPADFFPPAQVADDFKLPKHTVSFGFGTTVMITPHVAALFEFTPRVGFKLGRVTPVFDDDFNIVDFENNSFPAIAFGVQRNIGNHSFALTLSNTQTTTTSRYNSSNSLFSPRRLAFGFNLFRRF